MNKKSKNLDNNANDTLDDILDKNESSSEESQYETDENSNLESDIVANNKDLLSNDMSKNDQINEELKLKEEIESLKEEKLRLLAEMENLRKRSERDKIDSIKYGSINLARDILSPSDNLKRALDSISPEADKSKSINNLIDGLKMVQKEFMTILEKHGVKKIEAIEKKFDHNYHQAVLEVETDETDEGIVVQEIQSGFTMHDRLLRPTMVGVSKKHKNKKKSQKK